MTDYALEPNLAVEEFIDVLQRSTLAERRPVDDLSAMRGMLQHADIVLTARRDGLLVGIARALTDFNHCTYVADLAVDADYQRQGIGRQLLRLAHEAGGLHTALIVLAAPKAQTYYPHIGLTRHDSCWHVPRPARKKKTSRPAE